MKKICSLVHLLISWVVLNAQEKTDNGYTLDKANPSYGIFEFIKSDSINKSFPCLVFLPESYPKNKDKRYPVVYNLHGVNGSPLTEQGIRTLVNPASKIQEAASLFEVIIVCPLVGNTFYLNSPILSESKFASFVGLELPIFIDKKYRTINDRKGRFLAGFSMGGYGAVSLLCRYPDNFSVALNRAGLLDLATGVVDLNWDDAAFPIPIMGSYWKNQEAYSRNSCYTLVNRVANRKDVAFVIEVGRDDFLYKANLKFKNRLEELKLPYIYAEYPGGHMVSSSVMLSLLSHLQYFQKTVY